MAVLIYLAKILSNLIFLETNAPPMNLRLSPIKKQEALQDAIDEIRDKFDFTAIQKASVLTADSRVLERNKMIGGHAAAGGEKNDS
ncbi:hypothetical protein N568_0108845 [Lactococcus garvieae TRF1]|uniref:DNA polymerase IV n=1 Tax=Lactococcus garvieae TRF1 TaxID=1380772 RepID=V8AN75_9LACT|nr:hypothetical protein N568_0108845 [Lactococcus garvieae TRF1]